MFQHPTILLLLWILPIVAGLLVHAHRKRLAAARRFVAPPMVPRLMPAFGGPRPWIRGGLLLAGLTLAILAAARPQFGVYFKKTSHRGVDCFVLLDVSRSMLAEDVAPNRLERAKSDVRDLLKKLVGDRVGLVVFAGKPVLKTPLTTDEGFFLTALDDVDVRSAPRGGTLIGDAIRKALDAMPPRSDHDQVLVLLTDGEDQDSYPLEAAKLAAERGVKIFTVGLGDSDEGARIPIRDDAGRLEYLKDGGKEHWSKTDQGTLEKIATATGGVNIPAGTKEYDLGQIYEDHLAGLTRGEGVENLKCHHERYQWFLAFAVALLTIETAVRTTRFKKRGAEDENRGMKNGNRKLESKKRKRPAAVVAGIAAVGVFFALAISSMPVVAGGVDAAAARREAKQGLDAFRAGDFKAATESLAKADRSNRNDPRIAFDLACAYAASGEIDKAVERFRAAATARDAQVSAAANYNLGCLAVEQAKKLFGAKPEEADEKVRGEGVETFARAAGHFRDALAVDASHADARHNLETVRLWVKHIEEVWRQRDLEKRRKEMNLPQFLEMLERRGRELRTASKNLDKEPASPRRREAARGVEKSQRLLAEEIEPLKEKIREATAGPQTQGQNQNSGQRQPLNRPGAAAPPSEDARRAMDALLNLADDTRVAMSSAADSLGSDKPGEAIGRQAEAVEKIDQAFMVVSPFVQLVQKGVAAQEGLIALSKGGESAASSDKKTNEAKPEKSDWAEAAWNQRFIGGYARILPAKAKRELEQLEKTPAGATAVAPSPQGAVAAAPGTTPSSGPSPEQQEQQRKEMRRALQAGVDLAPKVEQLSAAAVVAMETGKPADALPRQEEALKLLKEMLPKQPDQQKKDQNKDQNNKDQNNKDQNKKNQDKRDQKGKDQENKKDQEQKDGKRDGKDQKKEDQQNQGKQNKDEKDKRDEKEAGKRDQPSQAKPKDASEQEAEAVLRRARQREQERREMEKEIQERNRRPDNPDKDW